MKRIILETAVGREKDVHALDLYEKLDVHGRFEKLVVTLSVMRAFSNFPGALRACAYFRDPTAVSRIIATLCLPLLLLPAATGVSQSEQKAEVEAEETKKSTAKISESTKQKPKSKSDANSKQDAPEKFIPSEEISEDLSVSFPVDI